MPQPVVDGINQLAARIEVSSHFINCSPPMMKIDSLEARGLMQRVGSDSIGANGGFASFKDFLQRLHSVEEKGDSTKSTIHMLENDIHIRRVKSSTVTETEWTIFSPAPPSHLR